jgi:3-methyladenine DNA glycosylase Mpg
MTQLMAMQKLPREFYDQDTILVAKELLGKYLVHHNGHDLLSDDLYIARSLDAKPLAIIKRPRVGVYYAKHWAKRHLRFYIKNNPYISKK